MSQAYAAGKRALGSCDRCGFDYLLKKLRPQVVDLVETGLLVCPECLDKDQPQLQLGRWPVNDPQALRDPRPDAGLTASRYGDSIRYDFDTEASADLWNVVPANDNATVTWQSPSETILLTADEADPRLSRKSTPASPVSFDPAVYRYVRCRMKVNDFGADRYDWQGSFYWYRESDAPSFVASRCHRALGGRPDFEQMGNPWHLLTWDMLGVTDWSTESNIAGIRFDLLDKADTVVEIDYIRVEKE